MEMKIKVAFCYFSNEGEKDFLNLSVMNLNKLLKRYPEVDGKVFIIDDMHNDKRIKSNDFGDSVTILRSTFKNEGIEGVEGIFKTFCEVYNNFAFDYVINLREDCMLNQIGFIIAVEQRLKKSGRGGTLMQISKQNGDIYTDEWQCYSKGGIQSIMNIVNGMKMDDPKANIIRKRVSNNPYTNRLISYLLEMSMGTRINIDFLEGVKTNINFFNMGENDKKEDFLAVTFKSDDVIRKESLDAMKKSIEENFVEESDFIKMVKGKRVAIVGNAEVTKNYSNEIDSADIVIRFNNFYNYESGNVGKRVDALVLTGTSACHDILPNGLSDQKEIIQEQKPKIFLLTEIPNQRIVNVHSRFNGCEIHMLGNPSWMLPLTSGTIALAMLADCYDVQVNCYGFSDGDAWNTYNETYNKLHKATCGLDEDTIRIESLKKLCTKSWH